MNKPLAFILLFLFAHVYQSVCWATSEDWKHKSEADWKQSLTPEQFKICRQKAGERPFSGKYYPLRRDEKGIYRCALCGQELFSSDSKFDPDMGFASFREPINQNDIELKVERRLLFFERTEVLCSRCGSHLGYVFDDGPTPTGKRFAINSACLDFVPQK